MSSVSLKNVSTTYSIKDINLEVDEGELIVILGQSGAGKSTLLNVIAGLTPYTGNVFIGKNKVDNLKPVERRVGYVFQELCIFPHMTVFENVGFGLNAAGILKDKTQKLVLETLEFLKISSLKDRYPKTLSGGEKQRVALARALVLNPSVMLMDEPLSSVDFSIAKYLRLELKELQKNLNLTTFYVTHNFDEAKELADKIAVIDDGKLKQVGKVEDIFLNPNPEIQHFIPAPNILSCKEVKILNAGLAQVCCEDMIFIIPTEKYSINKIAILPNDINVTYFKPFGPDINRFEGRILEVQKIGSFTKCKIKVGKNVLEAEIPKSTVEKENFVPGKKVWLKISMKKISVL